jgi:hypothetical protein
VCLRPTCYSLHVPVCLIIHNLDIGSLHYDSLTLPRHIAGPDSGSVRCGFCESIAIGVTNGGFTIPAILTDIIELASWPKDDVARVIVIDKKFNFAGSKGTETASGGRSASNARSNASQDGSDDPKWCSNS